MSNILSEMTYIILLQIL